MDLNSLFSGFDEREILWIVASLIVVALVAVDLRTAAAELRQRIATAFSAERIALGDLPPGWTVPRQ